MGGDEGVRVMVDGAALARRRHERINLLLVGDQQRIEQALESHPNLREASDILHAPDVVSGSERPTQALRRAGTTSMGLAIDAVKRGQAGAAVSAGNTGALMAMAKLALRTMPGIDRPALAALMPTLGDNDVVMLDLGANTECDARNLVQFAIMGAAYSRIVTGLERPRVRLLNIGTEEMKGTDALRDAAAELKTAMAELALSFDGFTEADKLSRGDVDVIVTDGFSGNIALKAMEGAVFLGLNGIVVKSHGSATVAGVANAVTVCARLLEENLTERIAADLSHLGAEMIRSSGRAPRRLASGGAAGAAA
jgi:glycerol-3-phosphate acyltransferase PlsX